MTLTLPARWTSASSGIYIECLISIEFVLSLSLSLSLSTHTHTHTHTHTFSTMIQAGSKGDAEVLKPTLMNFAPAVLENVYVGLDAKLRAGGDLGYNLYKCGIVKGHENFDKVCVRCSL